MAVQRDAGATGSVGSSNQRCDSHPARPDEGKVRKASQVYAGRCMRQISTGNPL